MWQYHSYGSACTNFDAKQTPTTTLLLATVETNSIALSSVDLESVKRTNIASGHRAAALSRTKVVCSTVMNRPQMGFVNKSVEKTVFRAPVVNE